jgi:nitrite reductase/ring-hydroxylating ferredoxin subunit/DMSO/TMAO reductase YedYZ heme-binding membrane subunit
MSVGYRAVLWNRQKRIYDLVLVSCSVLYLALFVGVGAIARPDATIETLLIRGLGTCALLLLHVVLSIGPLARLDPRFLPLLYNRRHLGVVTFLVGAAHAGFSVFQFHALGNVDPLVSVLLSNPRYRSLGQFPFEALGLAALVVLFLMAATSHDFWLHNLSAPTWKRLHMLVYVAYALLVLHVTLGVLQAETDPWLAGLLGVGLVWILTLHIVAGWRERRVDRERALEASEGWVDVCAVDEIPESRARVVTLAGERVAVFRYDGKISALSSVCQHQNGPLGEGQVIDGCVTCPWHGYQYVPETGQSPPPFTERVPTFRVRLAGRRVLVDPRPLPPATRTEPARFDDGGTRSTPDDELYVGYRDRAPRAIARHVRATSVGLFALASLVPVVLVLRQAPLGDGIFEFGTLRAFEGIVEERPYPHLLVPRPGAVSSTAPSWSAWPLVARGKHGAGDLAHGLAGHAVRVEGQLIYREGRTMLELDGAPLTPLAADRARTLEALPFPGRLDLGEWTLEGEIVDAKCWLGVMKPGRAKPHRACASRCIAGGVPPLFVVRDESGAEEAYLLVDQDDGPVNDAVAAVVAEPLAIRGSIRRDGDRLILRADPRTYRRLGD